MNTTKKINLCLTFFIVAFAANAQNDDFEKDFKAFTYQAEKEYTDFRDRANKDYAEFIKKAWQQFKSSPAEPAPVKEKPAPPQPYIDDDNKKEEKEIPIIEVLPIVKPKPQPNPIEPIKPEPCPKVEPFVFSFYGTNMQVAMDEKHLFALSGNTENDISVAWKVLSSNKYDNVIEDCLNLRAKHNLCDWAYLNMLQQLAEQFLGKGNEAVLLTAYIYCQSGYKMRLAKNNNEDIYMLVASDHCIYGIRYFNIDGERYYALNCPDTSLYICKASFPREQALSLFISREIKLASNKSEVRSFRSEHFPQMGADVCNNKNLMDFYNSYPSSEINDNLMTRWAMYANTPMDEDVKQMLYPALRNAIKGKTQLEAVGMLLNFVQTAFVYGYDDEVWGRDRAFFAEESLYYPYCDCEDRSILFSRLVRDLVGLKVILVFYPGHLATAVHFTDNVCGDYIVLNNSKFTVCDPTYIPAPVGATMPEMDNGTAKVILLD